jgi:AdoMet-dependent rRNA methyltransferase SPB1
LWLFDGSQGKKDLVAVDSTDYDDANGGLKDREKEDTHDAAQEHSSTDIDTDEERRRFFLVSITTDM